jgi:pseudouridine kinase
MKRIVCIGGSNIDMFLKPINKLILEDSNPGNMHISYGGVGRNIAENLARLSLNPYFITVLGQDHQGRNIADFCRKIGIHIDPIYVAETPTYVAILNENNDMHVAISVMNEFDKLNQETIDKRKNIIDQADFLFLDTNINEQTMSYIFKTFSMPIFVDAISTSKAIRLIPFLKNIFALKVNYKEALALIRSNDMNINEIEVAKRILSFGVRHVFITLGASGAIYATNEGIQRSHFKPVETINTTGAGDAFMAGIIYAFMNQKTPLIYGVAAAKITLNANEAVSQNMNIEYLEKTVEELL